MIVTRFPDRFGKTLSHTQMSLTELHDLVLAETARSKDQLPLLKLAKFGDVRSDNGSLRHNDNANEISGVELDYDGEVVAFEEAVATAERYHLQALLYTSPSHTPGKPRWRIVLPTSCNQPPHERAKLVARVNGAFGGIFSDESFVLSQAYYYGSVNSNPDHRAVVVEGDAIDLRNNLDAIARGKKNGAAVDEIHTPGENPHAPIGLVVLALRVIPIPNDSFRDRNRIGMATWRATGGSAEGFQAFDTFMQKCKKYNSRNIAKRWRGYSKSPPTKIGAGTLFHMANEAFGGPDWDREFHQAVEAELNAPNDEDTQQQQLAWLKANEWPKPPAEETAAKPQEQKPKPEAPPPPPTRGSVMVRASEVTMRSKDWIWKGHLLRGAQELLSGDPGLGKSQVQICFIACATAGLPWPDGAKGISPCNVIMLTAEDTLDQEVVPRLIAAKANLDRVHILKSIRNDARTQRQFLLGEDLEQLERDVQLIGEVGLVCIDPITAYMGGKIDSHKATEVRSQLGPLKDFAERVNVAVSTITHPAKAAGKKAIDHFIGSQSFIAAGRIGHVCVAEFEEEEADDDSKGGRRERIPTGRILFTNVKNNTHLLMPTLAYRVEAIAVGRDPATHDVIEAPHAAWDGAVDITGDQAVAIAAGGDSGGGSKRDAMQVKVRQFLGEMLKNGPVPQKMIEEEAERRGFTENQLRTAKQKLPIESVKGADGAWSWRVIF